MDFNYPTGGNVNDGKVLKVKIGDRVRFEWSGNHNVKWMGDVSDCKTLAATDPSIFSGFDSSPFTLLAYPAWDGAVVSFACSVGSGSLAIGFGGDHAVTRSGKHSLKLPPVVEAPIHTF